MESKAKPAQKPANTNAKSQPENGVLLCKHEKESFYSQTIYLSGHGYVGCKFDNCTMIVTGPIFLLNECHFNNCNWRIETDILWGDPRSFMSIASLMNTIGGSYNLSEATTDKITKTA